MFSSLDESVHGTVRFGDISLIKIQGKGSIVFRSQNGQQHVLAEVYFIPSLRSNIISVGQLDEAGCKVDIRDGVMTIHEPSRGLLTRVKRMRNRLYTTILSIDTPVCLLAKNDDITWRWHSPYGHLHFRVLHSLAHKHMVRGMPEIDRVEDIYDGCILGKQHRAPFPCTSAYRADRALNLVHTDMCGLITLATLGGNSYFLLVVDDYSRFMWIEVIKCKSDAFKLFKKIKVMAEVDAQRG
jgi:hypothetical protein